MTIGTTSNDIRATDRERWMVATVLAAATAAYAILRFVKTPGFTSDLDQLWHAANALRSGGNPYEVVGPGRAFEWAFPLFYPLPAVLLALPFTFLPVALARLVFSIISAFGLGFALGGRWRTLWPMFASVSYFHAISRNQWSPLILAACWLPALGFVIAAKPNIGALALFAHDRRRAVLVAGLATALVVISFAVRPSWLGEWLAIVRSLPNQKIAIAQPAGFLLLGALLLWRTVDGRVLLAASVLPQTPSLYDALLLFFLCRTRRQALVVAALTHGAQWCVIALGPYATPGAYYDTLQRLSVGLLLIPCLVLAFINNGLPWGTRGASAHVATEPDATARTGRVDTLLAGSIVCSLVLQLWIVFRP